MLPSGVSTLRKDNIFYIPLCLFKKVTQLYSYTLKLMALIQIIHFDWKENLLEIGS